MVESVRMAEVSDSADATPHSTIGIVRCRIRRRLVCAGVPVESANGLGVAMWHR